MHFVGSTVCLKSFYSFCLHSTFSLVQMQLFMEELCTRLDWETDPLKNNPFLSGH